MKRFGWIAMVFVVVLCTRAFADLEGAKKALETVKKNIADDNMAGIDQDVKMVEFELKDTPDADKKPIQDELDGIKKKLFDAKVAKLKPGYTDSIETYFTNAKEGLANNRPDDAVGWADRLDEYLTHDDIVELFSKDEIAKYKERMAKYKKQGQEMAVTRNIDPMLTDLDGLEKETRDKLNEMKTANEGQNQMAINEISQSLETFGKRLQGFPQDNPKIKDAKARMDKLNAEFNQVAGAVLVKEKVQHIKDGWEMYKNEYEGWEAETAGPTLEEYGKVQGNTDMHAFKMPHSVALIKRADDFMQNLSQDDSYKQNASNPDVKAVVDGIAKMRADCYAKVVKAATTLVEQAEKLTVTNDNLGWVAPLPDDIKVALGDKSPEGQALKGRAQKILDNYQAGLKAAEEAEKVAYQKMLDVAAKAWPDMSAKYKTESGFDPNKPADFKGKLIKISDTDNLMGYRFKVGDFPFATTLNGVPIAGKYDPVVGKAVEEIEAKIKHSLGDYDPDGKWEVIARVEGNTGQMMQRKTATGDVKTTDGEKVGTVTQEYAEPVTAPIVTIVAAHCGPLSVSADQGAVNEAGVISSPAGVSTSGSGSSSGSALGGWVMRILFLVVGLVAAAAALLKAGYAPIASLPQAGEVQAKLGGDNLAYIGLGCAAWGLLWMLYGLIYRGFLVNAAIIAAGLYAALDFLAAKGLVKPDQLAKIKPMGVMIGLACAVITVLYLFTHGALWIL